MMEGPDQAYAQHDMYADIMKPSTESTGPLEYKSYTTVHPKSIEQQEKEAKISASLDQQQPGKQLYVGNLTWWTNDEELSTTIKECGITDLMSVKFFENRINGQSKGFALIEVASELSQRLITERLPNQTLHGQKPMVMSVNKQNLAMFESQARKDKPGGGNYRDDDYRDRKDRDDRDHRGYNKRDDRGRGPAPQPQIQPQIIPGLPAPGLIPGVLPGTIPAGSIVVDALGNIVQGGLPPGLIPGMPGGLQLNGPGLFPGALPGLQQGLLPAGLPMEGAQPVDPVTGLPLQTGGMNEADLESMRRNQAVASTAIQRATANANQGQFESGIETLVTAISLIKQSTTSNAEPAKQLIQSLQDCLHGLESQLVQHGGSRNDRERRRSPGDRRDRSRDRRDSRRDHRRDSRERSRDRSRERRHRDQGRERHGGGKPRGRDYSLSPVRGPIIPQDIPSGGDGKTRDRDREEQE